MIKAIETVYNGYRFRSRLEARWAVFFDAGNIEYEYEPEGFETSGKGYLPDFYLPQLGVHVEVKGKRDGWEQQVLRTSKYIEWGGPIRRLLILTDIPGKTDDGGLWHFPCFYFDGRNDRVSSSWFFFYDHYENRVDGNISFASYHHPKINTWDMERNEFSIEPKSDEELRRAAGMKSLFFDGIIDDGYNYRCNRLTFAALEAARQARFEHGETPRPKAKQLPKGKSLFDRFATTSR